MKERRPTKAKTDPRDVIAGERLLQRRIMAGLSQHDLGKIMGVTFQQVQKYERGINRMSAPRMHDVAAALAVPTSYFYDENGRNFEFEAGGDRETLEMVRIYKRLPKAARTSLRQLLRITAEYGAPEASSVEAKSTKD